MDDRAKEIFSEGVTVKAKGNGLYDVIDNATGLPLHHVKSVLIEAHNELWRKQPRITTTVDIDTNGVRCTLVFEDVERK